jgi:hypothetical protein
VGAKTGYNRGRLLFGDVKPLGQFFDSPLSGLVISKQQERFHRGYRIDAFENKLGYILRDDFAHDVYTNSQRFVSVGTLVVVFLVYS